MTTHTNYNFSTDNGVPIQIDGQKGFKIYPNDMKFVEKAAELYKEVQSVQDNLMKRYKELNVEVDENGVPVNADKAIELNNEQFDTIYSSIDKLLGDGVCEKVFKGRKDYDLLCDFLDFISNIIQEHRKSSISKYQPNRAQRRVSKKGIM